MAIDKEIIVGRFSDWMMRRDDDDNEGMTNFDREFGQNYAPETPPPTPPKPPKPRHLHIRSRRCCLQNRKTRGYEKKIS